MPLFSRDPLNLTNLHTRKYDGIVNERAIGIQPGPGNKGVVLTTKKANKANKPGSQLQTSTFGENTGARKIAKSVVGNTSGRDYRSDLHQSAVSRAGAVKKAQRQTKADKPAKLRGAKARKAESS